MLLCDLSLGETPCETRPSQVIKLGLDRVPIRQDFGAPSLFPRLESKPFIRGIYSASSFAAGPRDVMRNIVFGV